MTLNAHFALKSNSGSATNELAFLAFGQNCSKNVKSYLYTVSDKIVAQGSQFLAGFMQIFAGFDREGASNESGVVVNGDFRFFCSLYLRNLHIQGHNYYIVLCSPLLALASSLTPKRMTLNDLEWSFCVKIWFELGIQWAGILAFGENYSEICRATHITQRNKKCSPARDCTGDKCYGVIHWGYPKRKRQTSGLYSHSQFSLLLIHAVH